MVSKASDDFPDPDSPVKQMSLSRGRSSETLRRWGSRAPRITSLSDTPRAYRPVVACGAANPVSAGQPHDLVTPGLQLGGGDQLGPRPSRRQPHPGPFRLDHDDVARPVLVQPAECFADVARLPPQPRK